MITDASKFPQFSHKLTPFDHQQEALDLSWKEEYYALFMEMGTGKSKVMIDTMTMLFLNAQIDGVLIIAPKGAYLNWIDDEIPTHMLEWLPKRVTYYDTDAGKNQHKISEALIKPQDNCLDILCVNVESLNTDRAYDLVEEFLKYHYSMVIIDESTSIKSHTAKRTKRAYKLGEMADYRRILTGTPITNSPLDLYGQTQFLKPGILGHDNWVSFQSYYAIVRQITNGTRRWDMVVDYKNLEELSERIKKFSYRKLKSECLDLPEKLWINHYIEHTEEQAEAYRKMKEEALLMFSQTAMASSTSVITTMMKLHQINCGHVIDDEGHPHNIRNNRISELINLLKINRGQKIIIWCNFKQDVAMINQAIFEEFKKSPVLYYGESTTEQRRESLKGFRKGDDEWFVSTLATAGKGLTIVESHLNIYFSYNHNLELWLQSQDRTHRPGQHENVTYILMQIANTVDTKMLDNLKNKKDLANQVLDRETIIDLLN